MTVTNDRLPSRSEEHVSVQSHTKSYYSVADVVLQRDGRGKRPVVPYDRIEYRGVISRTETPA